MFVRGGRCTPRIRPGGGEESEGDGGGRDSLSVVGLRAHVAGDARPQLTRRGDDDGEEHHGGEEWHGPVWARSSFTGLGMGTARVFHLSGLPR